MSKKIIWLTALLGITSMPAYAMSEIMIDNSDFKELPRHITISIPKEIAGKPTANALVMATAAVTQLPPSSFSLIYRGILLTEPQLWISV